MNQDEIIELLRDYGWTDVARFLKWRLSPEGSSPASCSRTREAGRKPDATTDHTTAPPFPDQGGGELSSVVRLLNDAAAIHENVAKRGDKNPCGLTGEEWQTQQAAIYRYVSLLVESSLSDPLTQSGEGGNEVCPLQGCGMSFRASPAGCKSATCPKKMDTLSERERSGSGNDQADSSAVAD